MIVVTLPHHRGIWTGYMTQLLLPLDTTVTWPLLPLQEIKKIRCPKTPLASCQEGRRSLGLPPVRIRHPEWLTQRPGLGQQPIEIERSRKLLQRPGRGQRPIGIHHSLEIGLEPAGQAGVPQWSILRPSCAHSIPDFGPIKIQDSDLTWTTLNSGVYINRPSQASSRIQLTDFVETPSPDLASPHLPFSDLIETPLNRPLGS